MKFNCKKFFRSFTYAAKGIKACVGREQNLSFHLLTTVLVIGGGFFFGINNMEWVAIILCFGMVISAELFNSAIERLTDLVSPEWNQQAGLVKDIAAGAVLVAAIASLAIGLIIFLPYLANLYFHS